MPDYLLISIDNCPFCEKTKALLTEKNLTYSEVNCADYPDAAAALKAVGRSTFPLILKPIGGFAELEELLK